MVHLLGRVLARMYGLSRCDSAWTWESKGPLCSTLRTSSIRQRKHPLPPFACSSWFRSIYFKQRRLTSWQILLVVFFSTPMLACEENKAETVDSVSLPHCKRRVALKGLKRCMVWLLVKKAPSSRTQCRVLLGSVSPVFTEGANGLTACFLPWVDSRGNEKSSACMWILLKPFFFSALHLRFPPTQPQRKVRER